jgi:hypothetical protein
MLCTEEKILYLKIQLKEDVHPTFSLEKLYGHAFAGLPVTARLYPFGKFPHLLDFERKIQCVCEDNTGKGSGREKPGIPLAV